MYRWISLNYLSRSYCYHIIIVNRWIILLSYYNGQFFIMPKADSTAQYQYLELGHLYFLLPMHKLDSLISPSEMASRFGSSQVDFEFHEPGQNPSCVLRFVPEFPCRPARCHGCHVSIPGVTDAMCALSANHVSRPLCVPLSVCQVSRLPCVVPPGVKPAMCRSTKHHERHVSVRKVSRAHVSAVRQPSHISVLTHHISTPAVAVSLPTDSNPRLPAL
jgi:hypothetical protein